MNTSNTQVTIPTMHQKHSSKPVSSVSHPIEDERGGELGGAERGGGRIISEGLLVMQRFQRDI